MASQKRTLIILTVICLVLAIAVIVLKNVDLTPKTEEDELYTLIDVPLADIVSFEIINAKGDYTYNYDTENKTFTCTKYPDMTLDGDALYKVMSAASTIQTYTKTELENPEDYGLIKPYIELIVTTNTDVYDFVFGDKNDVVGQYYCAVKGNEKEVYMIGATKTEKFDCSIMDFKVE